MKKMLILAGIIFATSSANAQSLSTTVAAGADNATNKIAEQAQASKLKLEDMHFAQPIHDFGTIQEGPSAEHVFEFVNKGKEPIIITNASASCGCTTPSYTKDPVLPGQKGSIKAVYNTQGRVAPFTKTISITSNAGIKVLTIKGEVEKAPSGSVPENNSMIKTR